MSDVKVTTVQNPHQNPHPDPLPEYRERETGEYRERGLALPAPRCPVTIRPAVSGDVPFLDSLQRIHSKQVGWMPAAQLEGKVKLGQVLIAEEPSPQPSPGVPGEGAKRVGYCIGHDQYFKRDDVGIVYQLNVVPAKQRALIGATLVKAMFDRAAYGCRLFCCWCAQDIEANRFWESLGFVPLAFRAGGRGKGRVHIFWQRRIRAGDSTTPYWFPSQTTSGSIREDRLVFPIPPGTHWRDAKPIILPGMASDQPRALPERRKRESKPAGLPVKNPATIAAGGLRFVAVANEVAPESKPKREKVKNDPKLVAAARELRDRWLEHANARPEALPSRGKYDVTRALSDARSTIQVLLDIPALPAAMAA